VPGIFKSFKDCGGKNREASFVFTDERDLVEKGYVYMSLPVEDEEV